MQTRDFFIVGRFGSGAALLGGILFASIFALLPSSAEAECPQWVVTAEWRLWQDNGVRVLMKLEQTATALKGKASYPIPDRPERTGEVTGSVKGDKVELQISWADGQISIFNGRIGPNGMIEGNTHDKAKPDDEGTWFSDPNAMRCADAAAKPPAPTTSTP